MNGRRTVVAIQRTVAVATERKLDIGQYGRCLCAMVWPAQKNVSLTRVGRDAVL